MILISHILAIRLSGNISRSGALGNQTLAIHIQNYPGSSRIILDHSGPPQLIQGHPGPSRIIRPIQNQPGPSNQTPTSPFGSPLTWVTPLRSTSSIEVPVNWGTRPGLEPPQPGHSFSCWSYSVNSSDMAATSDLETSHLTQHLTPCAAPQALHNPADLAQRRRPGNLRPCAQKWQTAAAAAQAARANATFRPRVAP